MPTPNERAISFEAAKLHALHSLLSLPELTTQAPWGMAVEEKQLALNCSEGSRFVISLQVCVSPMFFLRKQDQKIKTSSKHDRARTALALFNSHLSTARGSAITAEQHQQRRRLDLFDVFDVFE